jgi:4-nitrophenyl phosphatase
LIYAKLCFFSKHAFQAYQAMEEIKHINNVAGLIIDMDGVLWHGNNPIEGLNEFFTTLRELNLPFVLATNNASLTQQQYIDKLDTMGVGVEAKEVLTSSMATASFLDKHQPKDKRRVFVIGEDGLRQPLLEHGFELTELYQISETDKADLVVTGLDRALSWDKLSTATLNLKAGAAFFATNADTTLPSERGDLFGNGGTIAALEAVTGVKATSIGKPEPILYQQALATLGTNHDNTIAIGDRLNTDILGAVNAGLRSILVLTGISTLEELAQVDYQPTWVMKDITEVSKALRNAL